MNDVPNPAEHRALEAIDLDGLIGCLAELIPFRSLGGDEGPIQDHIAARMAEIGFDVDAWDIDLDALRRHPSYSADIERESARGVVGRLGRGDGPTLVLNGHVDVVDAGEPRLWTVPPWKATVKSGRVYGRGSTDMKGGLCCALFAAKAVHDAGVELPGSVLVHSVVGEEDGGMGTLAAIQRGHVGEAAIVLEPTELAIAPAQAGALNFRLTVPGRAAHGALRAEGESPFDHYVPLYEAMRALEATRNEGVDDPLFADYELPFALCIGTVRSGVWSSTVAETLVCEGRLGVAVDEDPDDARRALERTIREAAARDPWLRDHPPVLAWVGARFAPASIAPDHFLVSALAAAHEDAGGGSAIVRGVPYGADMRLLVNEGGVPTVIYGPGDVRRAHAPDEFVPIDDLASVTRTLVLAILRLCGAT